MAAHASDTTAEMQRADSKAHKTASLAKTPSLWCIETPCFIQSQQGKE